MKKRRTNAEILKVPGAALRKIRKISNKARVPVEQVFQDALKNGILSLEEMYKAVVESRQTLLEFRKTRDAKWKEQNEATARDDDGGKSHLVPNEQNEAHTQAELPDEKDNGQAELSGDVHGSGCSGSDFGVRPVGEGSLEYAGDGDAITQDWPPSEPDDAHELSGFGAQDSSDLGVADSALQYRPS